MLFRHTSTTLKSIPKKYIIYIIFIIATQTISLNTPKAQSKSTPKKIPDKYTTDFSVSSLAKRTDYLIKFNIQEVGFELDKGHTYYKLCNIHVLIKFSKTSEPFNPPTSKDGCVVVHVGRPANIKHNLIQRPEGEYISFCKKIDKNKHPNAKAKYNYAVNAKEAVFRIYKKRELPYVFSSAGRPVLGISLKGRVYLGKPNTKQITTPSGKAIVIDQTRLKHTGLKTFQFIIEIKKSIARDAKYNFESNRPSGIVF